VTVVSSSTSNAITIEEEGMKLAKKYRIQFCRCVDGEN